MLRRRSCCSRLGIQEMWTGLLMVVQITNSMRSDIRCSGIGASGRRVSAHGSGDNGGLNAVR